MSNYQLGIRTSLHTTRPCIVLSDGDKDIAEIDPESIAVMRVGRLDDRRAVFVAHMFAKEEVPNDEKVRGLD